MVNEDKLRYFLKRVTAELHETQERLREAEAGDAEPIVIVGMACRYPGGVESPEDLWRLLDDGSDGIVTFPDDRGWDLEGLYHPDPDHPGTSYTREGGFLGGAGSFDPGPFGISPREALSMDPQHRLLLEASWEAFEAAGVPIEEVRGSRTGVFAGVMYNDYAMVLGQSADAAEGSMGTGGSIASGRVSYHFGLEGPAVTIDTACSSSLVALHLAAQSLRAGECDLALAGGVTVMSTPNTFIGFARQRGLATDGRCKSYADAADGTGWGEGVGMLVVERLSDARRLGHRILAVVAGSAVNQDGASNGLTAPNGPSQQRVIRQALRTAGLAPADVDVVEGHGTGTTLGDPIEAQALLATYGRDRAEDAPLWLGSVKSNLGHTQAAAGVAGIIKMILAMRHENLPRTLHVDAPSTEVDWSAGAVRLLTEAQPWPAGGSPRRAGISSFGISGTNAHIILAEPPAAEPSVDGETPLNRVPLVLTAHSEVALAGQAERLGQFLQADPGCSMEDAGLSLASRSPLEYRAVLPVADRSELLSAESLLEGSIRGRVVEGRTAFVFTGQGAQRVGMGRELYNQYPVFAAAFDEVCEHLDELLGRSLREAVFADGDALDGTGLAQPALFALEVAQMTLLASWGVVPEAVTGHSIGEITAAHVAGVLTLADAATLVAARGRLMQALPEGGAMLAVGASEADVLAALGDLDLDVAAVNGPYAMVVSGPVAQIETFASEATNRSWRTSRLRTSHAFHSALMQPMLAEFDSVVRQLTFAEPRLAAVSTVTGRPVEAGQWSDPGYWVDQVRRPVRFADAVRTLDEDGVVRYLEVGPDAALTPMIHATLEEPVAVALLRRTHEENASALKALGELFVSGGTVDWASLFAGTGAKRIDLPAYAFQHQHYWPRPRVHTDGHPGAFGLIATGHPLLAATVALADRDGLVLTGRLSLQTHPWLADHQVLDQVVVPGTALVEMALAAGERVDAPVLDELLLQAPLVLPERGGLRIQVRIAAADADGRHAISVHSQPEDSEDEEDWTGHAAGLLCAEAGADDSEGLLVWPPAGADEVPIDELYPALAEAGLVYGPVFQGLQRVWRRDGEVFAEVQLADPAEGFGLHPALLDAALHAVAPSGLLTGDGIRLPFAFSGVQVLAAGASALRVRMTATSATDTVQLEIADGSGLPVARVNSLALRAVSADQLLGADPVGRSLFALDWVEGPLPEFTSAQSWPKIIPGQKIPESSEVLVLDCTATAADCTAAAVRESTAAVLATVQSWLNEPAWNDGKLVVLTAGAVAAGPDDAVTGLPNAPIWGLVRAAQAEHPDRIVLIDFASSTSASPDLAAILAAGYSQAAVRGEQILIPRLVRATINPETPSLGEGTVVVTGATGTLGALLTRHLVAVHGVRELLLLSRSGHSAPTAPELLADLAAAGVTARLVACDVSDPEAVTAALSGVSISAVIHTAGVLDDGLLTTLTPARLDAVLRAKVDAVLNLRAATSEHDLAAFVMFSSAAGLFGNAGQANYAAANAFLDAFAAQLRHAGVPGLSLAWGLWETETGMGAAEQERMRRSGILPLSAERGLALFDAALSTDRPLLALLGLDLGTLRVAAGSGMLPALLQELVRVPGRAAPVSGLARQLAGLSEDERKQALLTLVSAHVAGVLGHTGQDAVPVDRAFSELGFDSLTAVEFRNRLAAATGLRLPSTLVFDYPDTARLAAFLAGELAGSAAAVTVATGSGAIDEPVAIVGMSCRYPGEVASPEELWNLLAAGGDGVGEFPSDRGWDLETLYHPDPDRDGTSYAREGGFLYNAGNFDPGMFGISPREALGIDPQHRLLLESSWEAFESAGLDVSSLRGSRTGVFVGVMYTDYAMVLGQSADPSEGSMGTGGSVASGRVSYTFGLEGPAVTVDTACSSSLVALHLAVQSVRSGESAMALAGGVTVMATPGTFVGFSRQRGLAADGRCKSFAEGADGTGWGEGVGMLLVERLSDARRLGHPVLAVVAGSAVNQDGASNGLTAPNGPSQQRVIRQALANARLEPSQVDAVEAHGTGTKLGDPIEAQALLATYGQDRKQPLWLGSVKSNLGHTQAAAGVAGIIKMVMAMRHESLPRTLHVDAPSSQVDWSEGAVQLLTEAQPWPVSDQPRRAGISAFGISGTNAHIIIEEAPAAPSGNAQEPAVLPVLPVLLTANDDAALSAQAERLLAFLAERPETRLLDLAGSLALREPLPHRAVITAESTGELMSSLADTAVGRFSSVKARPGRMAFVFTGQGAQRTGMGRELHATFEVFATAFDEACAALDPHLDQPLASLVLEPSADEQALDPTGLAQPALFAVEVGLLALLRSWGIKPEFVVGHSIGEITAAYAAGVLSLTDAATLVAARGRLMQALPEGGAMLAVGADEASVLSTTSDLDLAAVNGPDSVVLSGSVEAVEAFAAIAIERGWKNSRLRTSHAFHSVLMEPMLAEFAEVVAGLTFSEPEVAAFSTVTGARLESGRWTDPQYWVDQVRRPVRFADAVAALIEIGVTRFVEVGPDTVLTPMIHTVAADTEDLLAVPMMRRDRAESATAVRALTELFAQGEKINWSTIFAGSARIELPSYPFQHQRFWPRPKTGGDGDAAGLGLTASGHPLMGATVVLADRDGLVLTGRLSLRSHPWLVDHRVFGRIVLPGAALVEMALAAGIRSGAAELEELVLQAPLIVPDRAGVRLQVTVGAADDEGRHPVTVYSSTEEEEDESWVVHAEGSMRVPSAATVKGDALLVWPPTGAEEVPIDGLYAELAAAGLEYGPAFQGLRALWRRGQEVFAEVSVEQAATGFGLHPALLDAALHAIAPGRLLADDGGIKLPFAFSGVRLHAAGPPSLRVRLTALTAADTVGLEIADGSGLPVAEIERLSLRAVAAEQLAGPNPAARALFRVEWAPVALAAQPSTLEIPVLEPGRPLPEPSDLLVLDCTGEVAVTPVAVREQTAAVLGTLQSWLADPARSGRLVVVTSGAIATGPDDTVPGLAAAPIWGLIRSAQTEQTGRVVLVDTDTDLPTVLGLLPSALASGEAQLALRNSKLLAPQLVRASCEPQEVEFGTGTTVLTGATGALGGVIARHLVTAHGVTDLLLLSRRGPAAPGSAELVAELTAAGAQVRLEACDLADPDAVHGLLADVRVSTVVHAAGVLDDVLLADLTPERLDVVLRAKVDAGLNLRAAAAGPDLVSFVLFSSAAGVLGNAGQANYAAANAFLDALAARLRSEGVAATSLAWGLWDTGAGMSGELSEAERERMRGGGVLPLGIEQGLAAFDLALAADQALLVPISLDRAALRSVAGLGLLPALLERLAGGSRQPQTSALAGQLAGLPAEERDRAVLNLVLAEVRTVLGHGTGEPIPADRAFSELGFESMTAVELRNRLAVVTGLRLPSTLVFDYPDAQRLARFLGEELAGTAAAAPVATGEGATADDPIVIVGMSCRYPGDVSSPEDLWCLLAAGDDGIGGFPSDRGWDLENLYHPDPDHPGTSYSCDGGFLYQAANFDPGVFGISPREALGMDPQHRLLMEASWETFERAGVSVDSVRGSRTGVFVGVMYTDYAMVLGQSVDSAEGSMGTSASVASGRVSYTFGLEGPAVTVDTACSSSLVALHLAVQSVRSGESTMALAGGVTVMATPNTFIGFSRQRGLATDGRCKSFAEAADGTGWGEGVGMVLVERLSDARRLGHPVLAVVAGSAVNQDGASNGLTAPNGPSQQRVIRQALSNAGLAPADVDVVEAHGTGTRLGDPIEAQAVLATYGQNRPNPLWLGSIKSNLGHTQAAAGVAGIIKIILALRHQELPRTLHVDRPSTSVDWTQGAVSLLTEEQPWPVQSGRPRRAGISAFGISGTNAHVILEEPPVLESLPVATAIDRPVVPVVLTGNGEAGLRDTAARLADYLTPEIPILDVAAAAAGREKFGCRAVIVNGDLEAALAALVAGESFPGLVTGNARPGRLALLFTGQGSQRLGMGKGLYAAFPVFAQAFDEVCELLDEHLERSLLSVVFEDETALEATEFAQPALFALEVAQLALLNSWGIRPDVVVGHSIGEVAAAYAAGVLDLSDAVALVAARGRLMQALPAGGAMLAIQAGEDDVTALLAQVSIEIGDGCEFAAVNGPTSVVLSGAVEQIDRALAAAGECGWKATKLRTSHAFHSALMAPMLDEFGAVVRELTFKPAQLTAVSTVSGELLQPGQWSDPQYWVDQVRRPVRFAAAVSVLADSGVTRYLEVGPDGTLTAMVAAILGECPAVAVAALRKDRDETSSVLSAVAELFVDGAAMDWPAVFAGTGAGWAEIPTYAFQRQHYWPRPSPETPADAAGLGLTQAGHPMLGASLEVPGSGGLLLSGRLSRSTHAWLGEGRTTGSVLLELALAAGERAGLPVLDSLELGEPLVLPERGGVQVRVAVEASGVTVYGRREDQDEWAEHASGQLSATDSQDDVLSLMVWPPEGSEVVTGVWRTAAGEVFAEFSGTEPVDGYALPPGALDALLSAAVAGGLLDDAGAAEFHGVRRLAQTSDGVVRARLVRTGEDTVRVDLADGSGLPVAQLAGVRTAALSVGPDAPAEAERLLYGIEWLPFDLEASEPESWARITIGQALPATAEKVLVLDCSATAYLDASLVRERTGTVLATVREWLAEPAWAQSRLVVVTTGAVSTGAQDPVTDLVNAPVWGLLRSAQTEYPDRIFLVDLETPEDITSLLGGGEPQIAVRQGEVLVPRLTRVNPMASSTAFGAGFGTGTTVLTGATGTLGGLVARHLVSRHGVNDLLLLSKRGPEAPGAADMVNELTELGATVRLLACDLGDREAVRAALAETEVSAVVHAAGTLDDGLFAAQTPARLESVMRAKVDAALNLQAATADRELAAFVMFSSAAGVLGNAGQANYAAANIFLDAYAGRLRADGVPATAVAWGLWDMGSGMSGALSGADRERLRRSGIRPLTPDLGLTAFDAALATGRSDVVAVHFDLPALRALGSQQLPRVFAEMVPASQVSGTPDAGALKAFQRQLAELDDDARWNVLSDLVRRQSAIVLGAASPDAIDPERAFLEVGFDSLSSMELRNRLATATGLQLPATLLFDHATPQAVTHHLAGLFAEQAVAAASGGGEVFSGMYHQAAETGRSREFLEMLLTASTFRPSFDVPVNGNSPVRVIRLARGQEQPRLVCLPSILAISGPHEYARFAGALRELRDVVALTVPGFQPGDLLPVSAEAAIQALATVLLRDLGDEPFVLVGHSSGGMLAHALAAELEARKAGARALALIDIHPHDVSSFAAFQPAVQGQPGSESVDDVRLTSMAAYFRLFDGWKPAGIATPTLLVRASEPMPTWDGTSAWRSAWPGADTVLDTAGNHFTSMGEHAPATARLVHDWLLDRS